MALAVLGPKRPILPMNEFILRDLEDMDFNYLALPEVESLLSVIDDDTIHLTSYTLQATGTRPKC